MLPRTVLDFASEMERFTFKLLQLQNALALILLPGLSALIVDSIKVLLPHGS